MKAYSEDLRERVPAAVDAGMPHADRADHAGEFGDDWPLRAFAPGG